MKKKHFLTLFFVLFFAWMFTACGGADAEPTPTTADEPVAEEPAVEEPAVEEPVEEPNLPMNPLKNPWRNPPKRQPRNLRQSLSPP